MCVFYDWMILTFDQITDIHKKRFKMIVDVGYTIVQPTPLLTFDQITDTHKKTGGRGLMACQSQFKPKQNIAASAYFSNLKPDESAPEDGAL